MNIDIIMETLIAIERKTKDTKEKTAKSFVKRRMEKTMSEKTNEDKYISEKGLSSSMKMYKTLFDTEADCERACNIIRHMPHKLQKKENEKNNE